MKRYLALAVFAAAPFSVFMIACTKVVPPVPEAGVIVIDAAAVDTSDAGALATDETEAAAPLAVLPTAPHATAHTTATAATTGGPFQGSFGCQMSASQTGNAVSGTMKGSSFNCSVSGDICDGHIAVKANGKTDNRHFTLKRNASGDLTYHGDGEPQPTFCRKQ